MTITENLRDAAYIVIGMGVIGAQRAQVRREELRKQFAEQRSTFEARGADAVKLLNDTLKQADARLAPVVDAVEAQFDNVVEFLPTQAKQIIEPARQVGKEARAQVRARVAAV